MIGDGGGELQSSSSPVCELIRYQSSDGDWLVALPGMSLA